MTLLRSIDNKFGIALDGTIFNLRTGEVVPQDEPLFMLRARDEQALQTLHSYFAFCTNAGCTTEHLEGVQARMEQFRLFSVLRSEEMKQPGSSWRKGRGE